MLSVAQESICLTEFLIIGTKDNSFAGVTFL